ncbi:MAG: hypothetical protein M1838_000845, partial [Thelocarpon superellum]
DPNKKKRKRTARERDLCDVKIKITEYFPGAVVPQAFTPPGASSLEANNTNNFFAPGQPGGAPLQPAQPFGMMTPNASFAVDNAPAAAQQRYYTIQRVNGNGGNGKGDGVAGPHKHSLADSDRVKKNSVQRYTIREEKEKKKSEKTYHKKATGLASVTVKKHSKESDLKLFGSCFCPFVQRIWIALEVKGIPYQYVEVDPYKKPDSLLEINRHIIPGFYRCLQTQDVGKQVEHAEELKVEISKVVDVADRQGPFFLGPAISVVDIQFAPWMLRLSRVLKPYRGWPDPEAGSRWGLWVTAIEGHDAVRATTSTDDLYLDSYERYADNRPNTSQLANAVNAGRGLP